MIAPSRDGRKCAQLHAASFAAPWSQAAFDALLAGPAAHAFGTDDGFILLHAIGDEAEIVTLAVAPPARRLGLAGKLIAHAQGTLGVRLMTLEVAADNAGARGFYEKSGFCVCGCRPAYYKRAAGRRVDAVLMQRDFSATMW